MRIDRIYRTWRGVVTLCAGLAVAQAQAGVTLTRMVAFQIHGTNGTHPRCELVIGQDGNLYGTTFTAGDPVALDGTVFRYVPGGGVNPLVKFNGANGAASQAGLTPGPNGTFYGNTSEGGPDDYGTIFQITTNGVLTPLVNFNSNNGAAPFGPMIKGNDGNYYGTTSAGGTNNAGTIYQMTPAGALTTIASFDGINNGAIPYGALYEDAEGNFYGTTSAGGTYDFGVVFKLNAGGALVPLVTFDGTNSATPYAGMVPGADGQLYGTTSGEGGGGYGTVFRVSLGGAFTNLVWFDGVNGYSPYGPLLLASDGNFYGTTIFGGTNNYGNVFRMTPAGVVTSLASFDGYFFGSAPESGLLEKTSGTFYGTTADGGPASDGTLFRLFVPPPPKFQSFTRTNGALTFGWTSTAGQLYQVQYKTNLAQTNWINLGAILNATNSATTVSDPTTNAGRFYRVQMLP